MPSWPIDTIRSLLEPSLRHLGFEVYELEQAGGGGRTLRIAIDSPDGVTLDDCARVSELVGPLLDQADLIPGPYTLEVSSPGAERPLKERSDYERSVGRRVNIHYRAAQAEAVVEGDLLRVDPEGIEVQVRAAAHGRRAAAPEAVRLFWDDILAARLAVSL